MPNKEEENSNLTLSKSQELVPTDDRVIAIASRLHWKPATAIRRIKNALPAVFEQQLYLVLGSSFRILPESMAKLLRIFLESRAMDRSDLDRIDMGKNLATSLFSEFSDFIRECLNLLKVLADKSTGISITIETAAWVVLNFGTDNPERLIEMVDCQLDEVCEFFGINSQRPYNERLRICIWVMAKKVIPMNQELGATDVLSFEDFLDLDSDQKKALRRGIGEELPDFLSMCSHELTGNGCLRSLKDWGIIK
ncbi:MAG: hypothetical protein ABR875_03895 [Minisyncoccia bacterium]|jgi:hypothetical protein